MATKNAYAQYWNNGVVGCVGGGADYWQIDSYSTESAYLFVKPTAMGIPVGSTITNIRIDFQYRQTTYQDKGGIGYSSTFYWRPVYSTAPASGISVDSAITEVGSQETIKSKFGLSTSYTSVSNKNQNVSVSVSNNTIVGVKFTLDSDNLFDVRLWLKSVSFTVTYTEHTHSYTTETSRTPSTCYTKGSVTKKCSCGATQTTDLALDPNNHAGGTEVRNAKTATCTATGYTGDTHCKGCGAKLSSGSTINALGHSYTSVATPPTETSSGYTTHTCSRCGHSYVDSYVHRITTKSNNDNYGIVTGGGDYADGKNATLTATPKAGYKFVKWNDGVTSATRTVTVTGNATYTAYFEIDKINNIIVNEVKPKDIYFDDSNIVFVVDGEIPTLPSSLYDTVDGYHFKVQNTVPSGMTKCKYVYRDLVKVYG